MVRPRKAISLLDDTRDTSPAGCHRPQGQCSTSSSEAAGQRQLGGRNEALSLLHDTRVQGTSQTAGCQEPHTGTFPHTCQSPLPSGEAHGQHT
jgi:hypothetical protein